MSKKAVTDILEGMTKDDLAAWIRSQYFYQPKISDVLYSRWQRQSAEVLEEMQKEIRAFDAVDFKERDRLAARFNESKDLEEKLRLLELMEPYGKAVQDHIKRSQALDRKGKRVDALYEQIDVERQKERRS